MSASAWAPMATVTATLLTLLGGLRWYQRSRSPHPELARKLMHMLMGLVTLSFPWLFQEAWPVVLLCGLSLAGLLGMRLSRTLSTGVGTVLYGVARDSLGELVFPIAVALVFVMAKGDAILFVVPVLILALADAMAALIGVRYGTLQYGTAEGAKSIEGSSAFFFTAFLSVHVPLLLFTDTGRAETLLIAVVVGLLVMVAEAIAWRGLDNLFIPLGAFLLLRTYLPMHVDELALRLGVLCLLMGLTLLWRRRTTLNDAAVLAAALAGYVSWALGGLPWLWPPLVVFVAYSILATRAGQNRARQHTVHAVLAVVGPGLLWLLLAKGAGRPELIHCYTLAYAAHMGIISLARLSAITPGGSPAALIALSGLEGWAFVFLPYVLLQGGSAWVLLQASVAVVAVLLAVAGYQRLQRDADEAGARWRHQALSAMAASLAGLLPWQLLGGAMWN